MHENVNGGQNNSHHPRIFCEKLTVFCHHAHCVAMEEGSMEFSPNNFVEKRSFKNETLRKSDGLHVI